MCQAGSRGRSVKDVGYSKVVLDVLDSAVQQSMSNGGESCVCHICSLQLNNPTILRDHIRGTHLAIKAHHCNICGESFQWRMQVSRHKKRVHGSDGDQLLIYQWSVVTCDLTVKHLLFFSELSKSLCWYTTAFSICRLVDLLFDAIICQ